MLRRKNWRRGNRISELDFANEWSDGTGILIIQLGLQTGCDVQFELLTSFNPDLRYLKRVSGRGVLSRSGWPADMSAGNCVDYIN